MLCIPKRGCLIIYDGIIKCGLTPYLYNKAVNYEAAKGFASAIKKPAPAGN